MDTFLLYCLLSQCPNTSDTACPEIKSNLRNVILQGRDPELKVCQEGRVVPFVEAANNLLDELSKTAEVLDHAHGGTAYVDAINAQKAKVENTDLTPSGKIMNLLDQGQSFLQIAREQAEQPKVYFNSLDANSKFDAQLSSLSLSSIEQQKTLEQGDALPFDDFLDAYNKG